MRTMGMTLYGVAVLDRQSGREYGMHAECLAALRVAAGAAADRLVEMGPATSDADHLCHCGVALAQAPEVSA